jgi:hypothetical protein
LQHTLLMSVQDQQQVSKSGKTYGSCASESQ